MANIVHGSDSQGYQKGCKCDKCKAAHTQRSNEWRIKNGRGSINLGKGHDNNIDILLEVLHG